MYLRKIVPLFLVAALLASLPDWLYPQAGPPAPGPTDEDTALAEKSSPGQKLGAAPGKTAPGFERTVEMVSLKSAAPQMMRQHLLAIGQQWGLFPTLQIYVYSVSNTTRGLLVLKGYLEEVALARQIALSLDTAVSSESPASVLTPIPLEYLRAPAAKDRIIKLGQASGMNWIAGQFIVYPPGERGGLFFLGSDQEAERIAELAERLDQPQLASFRDSCARLWGQFRKDTSSGFVTVASYVISALLLLLIHFILIHIPVVGVVYERWFTLIWTKILDNLKGRDFAYEVIKSLVRTAVESAEQSSRRDVRLGLKTAADVSPEKKKAKAMLIAKDLLRFRGFNPDDPQIELLMDNLIEAAVYERNRPPVPPADPSTKSS